MMDITFSAGCRRLADETTIVIGDRLTSTLVLDSQAFSRICSLNDLVWD